MDWITSLFELKEHNSDNWVQIFLSFFPSYNDTRDTIIYLKTIVNDNRLIFNS